MYFLAPYRVYDKGSERVGNDSDSSSGRDKAAPVSSSTADIPNMLPRNMIIGILIFVSAVL